jgi:hypothetical protein
MVWLCKKCREPGRSEASTRIEAKLDNVLALLANLKSRMDTYEDRHEGCNAEAIEKKIVDTVEKKVEEYMEDMQERAKRKLNIIVSGLPESEKETAEERKTEDRERVRGLVKKIADVPEQEVDEPIRLGSFRIGTNPKPRLLKMTVKTEETKREIMKNVAKLNKGVPFEHRIYINDDSTPKERERIRKMRQEIEERTKEGEANLMINYRELKIVTRAVKSKSKESEHASEGQASNLEAAEAAPGSAPAGKDTKKK